MVSSRPLTLFPVTPFFGMFNVESKQRTSRFLLILFTLTCLCGESTWINTNSTVARGDDEIAEPNTGEAIVWENCQWSDAFGKPAEFPTSEASALQVLLLISTECPLARLYAERCQSLSSQWPEVDWVLVSVTPQDGPVDMQQFVKDMNLSLPLLKETSGVLVDALRIERVPTAVLRSADGRVLYVGRIDDQYEVGQRRNAPTSTELQDAIQACIEGKPVPVTRTEAPGCLITRRREVADDATLNYSEHIASILDRRCNHCHRPGDIGPMSFVDGEETSNWSDMILEVVEDGRMPPWNSSDAPGLFSNENRLTEDERNAIVQWVEQGAAVGDLTLRPEPPSYASSWRMPTEPDLIIEMPEAGFQVPASGTVDYQYFVIDPGWTEDRWVRAVQFLPGAPSVVHHAIAFTRSPEITRFDGLGMLAAFVPGQEPTTYQNGMARRIPAGSKIIFQMHYTPSGRPEVDRSQLGIWLAEEPQVQWEVVTGMVVESEFEIPPEASRFVVSKDHTNWPLGARLLSVAPHMHVRGRSVEVDLVRNDQVVRMLTVEKYDFNWQHTYKFSEPIELDNRSRIESRMSFDNSSANVANPDPRRHVRWGEQTWEEMAVLFLDIAIPRPDHSRTPDNSAADQQFRAKLDAFVSRFDRDGDAAVVRAEVPEALGAFAFDRLDQNGDGRIDSRDLRESGR